MSSIPQQAMGLPDALENYAHRWHMALSQNPGVPGPQRVTAALPTTPKNSSYAKTTWIGVDEKARKTLQVYGYATISRWTGKKLNDIIRGRQKRITIRDARIINSKVSVPVFEITAKNVVGMAKGTGLDVHRIVNEANNEPIFEETSKSTAVIKIEPEHREKLSALSQTNKQQLINALGKDFEKILTNKKAISIRHAIMIHIITRMVIFDLSVVAAQQPSMDQGQSTLARSTEVQETEEEVQELPELPTRKRPLNVSPGDSGSSPSKRQRTDDNDQPLPTPDVNAFPFYHQNPSFLDEGPFSLAMPPLDQINYPAYTYEIPQEQVFNGQAALPLTFYSPSESTATVVMDRNENSLNEQSSSPPTDSSQDLNALLESEDTSTMEETFSFSSLNEDWDDLKM